MKEQTKFQFKQKEVYPSILITLVAVFAVTVLLSNIASSRSFDPASTIHYFKSGSSSTNGVYRQLPTKIYHVVVTPTVANGGVLDISGFGLTNILNVQVTPVRNVSTPNDVPTVAIKTFSTNSIVYNIIQGNNAIVAIVGINVLSGAPNVFVPTPSDCTLYFTITGY